MLNPPLPLAGGAGVVPAATHDALSEHDAKAGMAGIGMSEQDMEMGMAQMSERYREGGNELYIGANGREHD